MYRIVSGGQIVTLCDKPHYVKTKPSSGAYIESDEEHAEAVSVNGTLYSLPGRPPVEGAPEAEISFVDGGVFTFENYVDKSKYTASIAALEDAMCEIDTGAE